MRIEIHRHRMAMSPNDDGRIAVGYDVLVPEEDVLPGAQGHIRIILSPGFREYRTYEDATWVTDLPRGFERYARWLDHEKAAQRQMLAHGPGALPGDPQLVRMARLLGLRRSCQQSGHRPLHDRAPEGEHTRENDIHPGRNTGRMTTRTPAPRARG